jgi:hypothetical protein
LCCCTDKLLKFSQLFLQINFFCLMLAWSSKGNEQDFVFDFLLWVVYSVLIA